MKRSNLWRALAQKIRDRMLRLAMLWISTICLAAFLTTARAQDAVDLQKLDAYFAATLQPWKVPGMAIAIVKDDRVVLAKGYGVRDVNKGGAVDENTLFAIASNSKAFNAAALAMLVDEGRLKWDDRVIDYLPYFQLYDPYVTYDMRIRDLLSHRSGLGTFSGDLLWWASTYSAEEVVRRARYLKPAAPFRAKYGYSNIMFLAAGQIVPAITGKKWTDFIQERILNPLGMSHTVLSVNDLQGKSNVATPHRVWQGKILPMAWQNWDNMAAAGGIISCVADMAKWLRLQLHRGALDGTRLFSEAASSEMWSPHTIIPVSKTSEKRFPSTHFRAYGLGWGMMDYHGRKVLTHGGGYDGMNSRVALVPEENLGMVILTNQMTSVQTALMYRILDAYLGGVEKEWSGEYLKITERNKRRAAERKARAAAARVPNTKPSLPLEAYTGTYGGPMYGDADVKLENGALVVQFLPTPDLKGDLIHWHYDTFQVKWRKQFAWFDEGWVQFLMDAGGKVIEMKVDVPNNDLWFTELEFKRKSE